MALPDPPFCERRIAGAGRSGPRRRGKRMETSSSTAAAPNGSPRSPSFRLFKRREDTDPSHGHRLERPRDPKGRSKLAPCFETSPRRVRTGQDQAACAFCAGVAERLPSLTATRRARSSSRAAGRRRCRSRGGRLFGDAPQGAAGRRLPVLATFSFLRPGDNRFRVRTAARSPVIDRALPPTLESSTALGPRPEDAMAHFRRSPHLARRVSPSLEILSHQRGGEENARFPSGSLVEFFTARS